MRLAGHPGVQHESGAGQAGVGEKRVEVGEIGEAGVDAAVKAAGECAMEVEAVAA